MVRFDARGLHSLAARDSAAAAVPVIKHPVGLFGTLERQDGGLTLIPFEGGRS